MLLATTSAVGMAAGIAVRMLAPPAESAAVAEPQAAVSAYDPTAATADVDAILGDPNRAYLQARARLVAHPDAATAALLARIDAVPPPSAAERKRLFDVLAEIGGPAIGARIADELRHGCAAESTEAGTFAAAGQWRPLLREQGAAGRDAIAGLVADRGLPVAVRAVLLDDLVDVTPDGAVTDLLVLVGRGHVELRRQLARSLRRRLRGHAELRVAVLGALDRGLEQADPERLTAIIQLRAAIEGGIDDGFIARIAALARDEGRSFGVRVASIRALVTEAERPAAQTALRAVADGALPGTSQVDEILVALALPALPPAEIAARVREHRLEHAPTPRLTSIAWAHLELPGDAWLEPAMGDPWPEVRATALGRVTTPCPRRIVTRIGAVVGSTSAGADGDASVQRAAVDALGRCADDASFVLLRGMLDDDAVASELSGEAARELARHFGARGADAVAKQLASRPERGYARRLAQALRHAESPTERVRETLCAWVDQGGDVGHAAAGSVLALWGDDGCDD